MRFPHADIGARICTCAVSAAPSAAPQAKNSNAPPGGSRSVRAAGPGSPPRRALRHNQLRERPIEGKRVVGASVHPAVPAGAWQTEIPQARGQNPNI